MGGKCRMMMSRITALMLLAGAAQAETLTFEADGEVRFIRCTDMSGMALCEMVFPAGDDLDTYSCVAMDAAGNPIASDNVLPEMDVLYSDLDAATVANVACRKN